MRVERMMEEFASSQTWASLAEVIEVTPMKKEKRERQRRRSRGKQEKRERVRRTYCRTKRQEDEEDSEWDSEEQEFKEEREGKEDFARIFPREWLIPRRQEGEFRKFIEFWKVSSKRMSEDIPNTFIPECEKEFFSGHTNTSWNALSRTSITSKGRRDSPEASRVIELLQPALESGFESAKSIAALTATELKRTHQSEEEKERLRGLFCAYALIADCISRINLLKGIHQSGWESAKGFLEGGMSKEEPENLKKLEESTSFFQAEGDAAGCDASPYSLAVFGLATARSGTPRRHNSSSSTQGFVCRQLQRRGYRRSFIDFRAKKKTPWFKAQFVPTNAGSPVPIT
ncbi:uncharacterized protein MONOS_11640 [Monocercomonoides exilis]|uniref:uncharacterized protein n=1 Tax=Monocercomonoides exilis TaxID=2049356 RepID=UPI00355A0CEF|nr:hypothetical protein MONOS_11640 [Monocercomonoides exilis]|eukprot:MONOS_11640.1-p1 / transcript=MONOS_11640.1 / gene=MONOS_11640 / organism=Monocercomonoides_exilis_PA203 / gene_product=unspecified product / transcript_product=unspecified product / location=Mono_scaffold00596:16447-17532(-) / protein_length=344 / sequence_SO=supercontig / SO=protein_coding / is_pseudo=false